MSTKSFYYILGSTCMCPQGYSFNVDGDCEGTDIQPAIIAHSNYCLAPSRLAAYTITKTRIYNFGFSSNSLALTSVPSGEVNTEMTISGQWRSTSATTGPMNRAGVWVDTDCNGTKDALTTGQQLTLGFNYNNTGSSRTVYIGIGGDNFFKLTVNGITIADTPQTLDGSGFSPSQYFTIWHVIPVVLIHGMNYFNAVATGDGSVNDAIGMTIYDNTAGQIASATDDSQLNILFTSSQLINQHIDLATCPTGYELDTSGGQGNYRCVKAEIIPCQ